MYTLENYWATLLFILLIFAAMFGVSFILFLIRFIRILINRAGLVSEINKCCKKQSFKIKWLRHPLASCFLKGRKPDFIVEDRFAVFIFSTAFKFKSRYAFNTEPCVDVLTYKRRLPLIGPRRMMETHARRYNFCLLDDEDLQHIILIHPEPESITDITANCTEAVGNNSVVFGSTFIVNKEYFLLNIDNYVENRKPSILDD